MLRLALVFSPGSGQLGSSDLVEHRNTGGHHLNVILVSVSQYQFIIINKSLFQCHDPSGILHGIFIAVYHLY